MATFTASNNTGMTLADQALEVQALHVYGLPGTVTDVQVSLGNLTHTFPADLDMLLVDSSHNLEFWSDIGKQVETPSDPNDLTNASFVISDFGVTALPGTSAVPVSGTTYKPADDDETETGSEFGYAGNINHAAPNGGSTFASAFGGVTPNGDWFLFIADDSHLDSGTLGSWGLTITTNSNAAAITGTGSDDTVNVNFTGTSSGTYTLNGGVQIAFSGVTSFSFDGAGGNDTLNITSNIAGPTTYTLSGNTISSSLAAPVTYTNTETVNLTDNGGDATFSYTSPTTAPTSIAGSSGTDTIHLSSTNDFTAAAVAMALVYDNAGQPAASFKSSQIGTGKIASVTGSANDDAFYVYADSNVDLSGVNFTSWTGGDTVQIYGRAAGEIIIGSSQDDNILGAGGADTLSGGGGNDVFQYGQASEIASGETIDGGAGLDGILVFNAQTYDFTGVGITNVEALGSFAAATVVLKGSQIGTGKIDTVVGNSFANSLVVTADGNVDLTTGMTFSSWTNSTVTINGTASGEILTGSNQNDTIRGFGGNDTINGGAGTDTAVFSGNRFAYTLTRSGNSLIVSGPDGTDTLTNIEKLQFSDVTMTLPLRDDFNGDDKGDILWRTDGGSLAVWGIDGTRISSSGFVNNGTAAVGAPGPDWHVVDGADYDGDSKADILWRTDSGSLAIWEMDGTRIKFQGYVNDGSAAVGAPGPDWHVAGLADFDGDGKNDVLWRTDSGSLAIWEMNGARIKFNGFVNNGTAAVGAPGPDWHIIDTADFDGDGKNDILWRTDSGSLAIWEMDGTRIKFQGFVNSGSAAVGAPGPDWHIADTTDFDGDGKNDILWRTDSGSLAIWELDGARIKFQGFVNDGAQAVGTPGADWHIV
jgi:hypothetical protein